MDAEVQAFKANNHRKWDWPSLARTSVLVLSGVVAIIFFLARLEGRMETPDQKQARIDASLRQHERLIRETLSPLSRDVQLLNSMHLGVHSHEVLNVKLENLERQIDRLTRTIEQGQRSTINDRPRP